MYNYIVHISSIHKAEPRFAFIAFYAIRSETAGQNLQEHKMLRPYMTTLSIELYILNIIKGLCF